MLFYPFRENITKLINEYSSKEKRISFNTITVNLFSQVYQLLYFLDGNKPQAKAYFDENHSKFEFIPKEVMIFTENEDLEEFIDNIPIANPIISFFTSDESQTNLIKALKMKKLENQFKNAKDIFMEILKFARNNDDLKMKRILLSFVSNFDNFMRITAYLHQNTFSIDVDKSLELFPQDLQEPIKIYNNYVNEYSGVASY